MVSYKPLWKLLIDKELSKHDLLVMAHMAPNTMTKMRRGEEVSMTILNKICRALDCSYGDIIEYIPDNTESEERSYS